MIKQLWWELGAASVNPPYLPLCTVRGSLDNTWSLFLVEISECCVSESFIQSGVPRARLQNLFGQFLNEGYRDTPVFL